MKRLFAFAFATLVAMCLVSCKPNEVKLHEAVGTVYGVAHGEMGGDGIVFYVDEDEGYALVCSMNDLRRDRQPNNDRTAAWERDFTWSIFGSDTVMERDTVMCELKRQFKYFVGTATTSSVPEGSIMVDVPEEYKVYNYEEKDSNIVIYPMLRYKANKENGDPVLEGYTSDSVPVLNFGVIGEFMEADTVIKSVKVDIFSDTTWKGKDTVVVGGQKYEIAVGDKLDRDKSVTLYRPYEDTVERRTRTFNYIVAGFSDTLVNNVRKGDRKFPNANEWKIEFDTNYSFSYIGIGKEDPNGKINTEKIVNADVPCRQQVTPDSSSAARACYTYYTNNYYEPRTEYAADVFYKAGQGEWYLPSRDELRKLFDARNKINETHVDTKGFEPLQNCYWSSNENNAQTAWYKCFSDNGIESYIPKANNSYTVNVRAVRRVEWPLK